MLDIVKEFEKTLRTSNLLKNYSENRAEAIIKDNIEALETTLTKGYSPSELFDFVGNGSFKEAYYLRGTRDIIIKFFSNENETEKEESLLERACNAGVEDLFIPTYFFWLTPSEYLPAYYLDETEPYEFCTERKNSQGELVWTTVTNPDYRWQELVGFILQPTCKLLAEKRGITMRSCSSQEETFSHYSFGSFIIDDFKTYKAMWKCTNDTDWWNSICNCYGIEMIYRFLEFAKDNNIRDLHCNNIGYYTINNIDYPIILDWLSN